MQNLACRKKRLSRKLTGERLISKMADHEQKAVTADASSGDMIFQPILEDGVFRFDCPPSDRDATYPSLSFINSKDRETPIMSHKAPLYTPTFECLFERQIVKIEVSSFIAFFDLVLHISFYLFSNAISSLTLFLLIDTMEFASNVASFWYFLLWNWRSQWTT